MIERLWDWLFPIGCAGCGELASPTLCKKCLVPLRPALRTVGDVPVLTSGPYHGPLQRAVLAMKSRGYAALADQLAARMAADLKTLGSLESDTVVLPVPTPQARRRYRGYNPVELLAFPLSRALALAYRPEVLACLGAGPERKAMSAAERALDVTTRFTVRAEAPKNVLLVDDVVTTGVTLMRCTEALRENGAGRIQAVALAWAGN